MNFQVYAIAVNFCLDQMQRAREVQYRYNLPRQQEFMDLPPSYDSIEPADDNISNETTFAFPPPPVFTIPPPPTDE